MFFNNNVQIDIAYCLWHPGKRPGAKQRITQNVQNVGLNVDSLQFFEIGKDYVDSIHSQPSHNCAQCHRMMICDCISKGYQNVLFLEDDAIFTNDIVDVLSRVKVPTSYHQLTLGGYCVDDRCQSRHEVPYIGTKESFEFVKVNFTWGLFGTVINQKSFSSMLTVHPSVLMDVSIRDTIENPEVYILNYPVIFERDEPAAVRDDRPPRDLYHQAVREGRINE